MKWNTTDDKNKLNFLANMVFQSEDFSAKEKREYDKIIVVDGTLKPNVLEGKVLREIR